MREQQPLSLIMVDVDYFKLYNDTYGHLSGDECLKMVAKKLSDVPKRAVDLCARYGGEEFTLLLPNTNLMQAEKLAERCRENISQLKIPHKSSSVCNVVTISAGVTSIVPAKGSSAPSLIKAADNAMYLAKEKGRNTVISS
jgi:diguanylate cyclase (GGDEF)-like protein